MTNEELIELLCDPDQTGKAVDEMNRLIVENPYFHTAYQLYIKGLQQTDNDNMAVHLNRIALHVRDRGVLYNYLNDPPALRRRIQSTENPPEESPAPSAPDASTPQKPDLPPADVEPQEVKEVIVEVKAIAEVKEAPVEVKAIAEEEISPPLKSEESEPPRAEVQPVAEEIKPEAAKEESKTDEVQTVSERKASAFDDIIDAFINSNPKIVPDNNNQYQANLSVGMQEIPDIGTEMLADIYATQGYKDKAIEIYEQLILKNPEKNIYFAAQIKRLKE